MFLLLLTMRGRNFSEISLKKHHYVGRYLEKLKQHAAFDRWGAVHILKHHTPNGPKGNVGHDTNRALQQKASIKRNLALTDQILPRTVNWSPIYNSGVVFKAANKLHKGKSAWAQRQKFLGTKA